MYRERERSTPIINMYTYMHIHVHTQTYMYMRSSTFQLHFPAPQRGCGMTQGRDRCCQFAPLHIRVCWFKSRPSDVVTERRFKKAECLTRNAPEF